MSRLVTVTGVTGVGKDYLLDKSLAGIERINRRNFGDELGRQLQTDKDGLASVDSAPDVRQAVASVALRMKELTPLFLSSHVVRSSSDTLQSVLDVEGLMLPDWYVVITAPPEIIIERVQKRNMQGARKSVMKSVDEIDDIQQHQLSIVQQVAHELNCDVLTVVNAPEVDTNSNVETIRQLATRVAVE